MPQSFDPTELVHDFGSKRSWQMSVAEIFTMQGILRRLEPELSIEIGTYKGGSLQLLSQLSKSVISLDVEPAVAESLKGQFPNVEFLSGDSRKILPPLISRINAGTQAVGFVLIDGSHSASGVRADIENILQLVPRRKVVILMHDSFNPESRQGMQLANWAACPYVHFVELDYVPGIYFHEAYDGAVARSMWAGFGMAVMLPNAREGALTIKESQRDLQQIIAPISCHSGFRDRVRRTLRKARIVFTR
jgi:hypothetical protein